PRGGAGLAAARQPGGGHGRRRPLRPHRAARPGGQGRAPVPGGRAVTALPDPQPSVSTVTLRNSRIDLALHRLRSGSGRPLLMLHGLGEHTAAAGPPHLAPSPGPVWGLRFPGHGASSLPVGGGYYCEVLMSDADTALAHLGRVTLYGRGLGAYVGLLVAGARPELVRGAILDDGPGM